MTTIERDIAGEEKSSLKQAPQIKARADGFHRRSFEDTTPKKDARGIRRLRRTLGKKASMTESDDRAEPVLVPKFGLLSDEETIVQDNTSCSITLTGDESSQNDGGSKSFDEVKREANLTILTSDFANGVEALLLNDCEPARIKEKGVRRKSALQPVHAGRDIWPIQEIMSTDSDDLLFMESDPEDEDDLVPVETNERRRGFQLPKLRIQKRTGPRYANDNDSPVTRLTTQPNVSVDESDSTLVDRLRTPTALRHRKPFGTAAAKSPPVAHPEPTYDKDHETRKGIHLRISRGRKPPSSPDAASAITPIPQKAKVSEKIMGKFRKGLAQEWKDFSGGGEYDGASSWDESDSDDSDRVTDDLRADSTVSGSRSIDYDESVLHAEDLFDMDVCGVFPSPVKDGVKLKSRRSKYRKELRVKPYHSFAPHKVFMTEEEIYQNMLRPSEFVEDLVSSVKPWYHIPEVQLTEMEKKYWGTSHDGRIGSLRVEVLGCVGISKYKSDVSVYLVCGDAAFATDVIHGSRSPMWPQSSRRAACFPIFHAYARLYVGVFDVTKRKKSENDSFCGRVEIGIPSLRPDTEYDVTLPIRVSSFIYDRRPRGVVRLRLSLHWFSERAAVLSYLPAPRNMTSTYHCVNSPSIPCADPKTFRNVAFTIHGQELPGKYTRDAFQATMREFTLYHQNLMFLAKQLFHDAVLYVNPLVSVYIFGSWMHCVWSASLRLAPVYFIGFLVLLLLDGYFRHCANCMRTSGYTPVSLTEILLALSNTAQSKQMQPLLAEKRPRRDAGDSTLDVEPCDHLEFPFSDGNEYKKRTIEETLVERSSSSRRDKQKELQRQERLSIYLKQERSVNDSIDLDTFLGMGDDAAQDIEGEGGEQGGLDFDSDQELDIHGDVDNVFDLYASDEEEEQFRPRFSSMSSTSIGTSIRSSVVLGPPQDVDIRPKMRIPPQVHLARFEDKLHKFTQSLSMDKVFACTLAYRPHSPTDGMFRSATDHRSCEEGAKKGRRIPLDDFDKRLGYRNRHSNPVTEIKSSFLGPLMRIFRIFCCIVRVVFNVGVWSDPYMSFWVLCFLILSMIVLIMFPWRLFFFAVGIVCFGPQNILVRRRLDLKESTQNDASTIDVSVVEVTNGESPLDDINGDDKSRKGNRRGLQNPIAIFKERRQKKLAERQELHKSANGQNHSELEHHSTEPSIDTRRPFAASGMQTNKKNLQPREIVVPYSRFRKERFYDWPPDPSVARATPVRFEDCRFDMSYSSLTPEKDMEDYSNLRHTTLTGKLD